jgi:hypothetical protein
MAQLGELTLLRRVVGRQGLEVGQLRLKILQFFVLRRHEAYLRDTPDLHVSSMFPA